MIEKQYRQLWQETFFNKVHKPLLWLDKDHLLRKQRLDIEKQLKQAKYTEEGLDKIFEEEKQKFLKGENQK